MRKAGFDAGFSRIYKKSEPVLRIHHKRNLEGGFFVPQEPHTGHGAWDFIFL